MGWGPTKEVNEDFFDRAVYRSKEKMKKMWYVLGISFSKYSHIRYHNRWQSTSQQLTQKVKSFLESQHKIIGPIHYNNRRKKGKGFDIYRFEFNSEKVFEDLASYKLDERKYNRPFPKDMEADFLSHFLRGFLEGHLPNHNNRVKSITIRRNEEFLNDLVDALMDQKIIKGKKRIKKPFLRFNMMDLVDIYEFTYFKDEDVIEEYGLWIPEKKAILEPSYLPARSSREIKVEAAINLLIEGMEAKEIIKDKHVDYSITSSSLK
jgi:hypothetical protein